MDNLNNDLLYRIFNYLSYEELFVIENVCQLWKDIVDRVLRGRHILILDDNKQINGNKQNYFNFGSKCSHSNDDKYKINNFLVNHIERWMLKNLKVYKRCPNIKSLAIRHSFCSGHIGVEERLIMSELIKKVESFPNLECIKITTFPHCPGQKILNLNFCPEIWFNFLIKFNLNIKHFTFIDEYGSLLYSDKRDKIIPSMPKIRKLFLHGNIWFKNGIYDMMSMRKLQKITIIRPRCRIARVDLKLISDNFTITSNIDSFIVLVMFMSKETVDSHPLFKDLYLFGLLFKKYCVERVDLNISLNSQNENDFHSLAIINHLEKLAINNDQNLLTEIYDKKLLVLLNKMPNVKELFISKITLSFKTFEEIFINIPSIKTLELTSNYLSLNREEFKRLWIMIANLNNLQVLSFVRCTKLDLTDIQHIKYSNSLKTIKYVSDSKTININCTAQFVLNYSKIINICKTLAVMHKNKTISLHLDYNFIYLINTLLKDLECSVNLPNNLSILTIEENYFNVNYDYFNDNTLYDII